MPNTCGIYYMNKEVPVNMSEFINNKNLLMSLNGN